MEHDLEEMLCIMGCAISFVLEIALLLSAIFATDINTIKRRDVFVCMYFAIIYVFIWRFDKHRKRRKIMLEILETIWVLNKILLGIMFLIAIIMTIILLITVLFEEISDIFKGGE